MHAWRLQRHRFCLPHPLYSSCFLCLPYLPYPPCLLCLPSSGVPILRQCPLPPLAGGPHFATASLATACRGCPFCGSAPCHRFNRQNKCYFRGLVAIYLLPFGVVPLSPLLPCLGPALCLTSIGRYKGTPCTRHGYPGFFSCCRCVGNQLLLGLGPLLCAWRRVAAKKGWHSTFLLCSAPPTPRPARRVRRCGVRWGCCPFIRGGPKPDKAATAPQAICLLGPWPCGCPAQKISFCPAGTFGRKRYRNASNNASKIALPPCITFFALPRPASGRPPLHCAKKGR